MESIVSKMMNKREEVSNPFLPPTRYAEKPSDPPNLPPPYVSILGHVQNQVKLFLNKEEMRARVVHSKLLDAGKTLPPNGGLGLRAIPDFVPEALGGAIVSTSI